MSEKEKLEEIERLYAVEERQSVILKKPTGRGLYEPVETTEEGALLIDLDHPRQREIWDIDNE
ncbi:hypothetical protein JF544_01680 [Halobacillus kuroshimensis]|uniref:Uncharacterized protein n=1 Tax=Halobacillus kuroshimensis TaxID=302481 RepID=A0ABS3DRF4_9BACI|nr:hypothetical protein [Halobacillus kuroshimensis]MBN8233930.1 hypothetical protein [Halobacillus kuroshimensis]